MFSQPHQKQEGSWQVHWEDRAYAVLTFIVLIIVFPKEAAVGAEMLIEIGLSGLGFARIGKQYHAVPIC